MGLMTECLIFFLSVATIVHITLTAFLLKSAYEVHTQP